MGLGLLDRLLEEEISEKVFFRSMLAPGRLQNLRKLGPDPQKSRPGAFQNRAWSPPRHHFHKMFNLRSLRGGFLFTKITFFGQLGSKLEAQEAPKSSPKPEKIDVKKQHVFGIDF